MKNLTIKALWAGTVLLAGGAVQAQINLSTLSYQQNFDSLGTVSAAWVDNSTIPGWYAANNSAGAVTPYTTFTVGSGGGTSSSTFYDLGVAGASDRAPGGAASSTRYTILGLRLVNDTGSLFNDVQIKYDLEQWSDRGTARNVLSYQTFSPGAGSLSVLSGWTTLGSADSPLPVNSTPATGLGNTTGLVPGITAGVSGLSLQPNDELWVRWEITKIAGANVTQGIDNVTVAVPEPSAAFLMLAGLLAITGWRKAVRN